MSYDIHHIKWLTGSLLLPARNVPAARALLDDPDRGTPEGVIPDVRFRRRSGRNEPLVPMPDEDVSLDRLNWRHDFSGRSWGYTDTDPEAPFVQFIALTEGTADFLVTWEDGETTGLHVEDGRCYKREVDFVLK